MYKIRKFNFSFLYDQVSVDSSEIIEVIRNHADQLDLVTCDSNQNDVMSMKLLQEALAVFNKIETLCFRNLKTIEDAIAQCTPDSFACHQGVES